MKKIMIALAFLGFTASVAEAQTCAKPKKKVVKKVAVCKRPVRKATASTYQVCREEGGYYTCCLYKNRVASK